MRRIIGAISGLGPFLLLWGVLPFAMALVAGPLLKNSELAAYLRNAVELAFDFKARQALGRDPAVSPRLKIVVYDDKTADAVGAPELSDARLLKLLLGLQATHPSLILVDRTFVFGIPDSGVREAYASLRQSPVPIAAAAYLSPVAIGKRPALAEDRPEFQAQAYGSETVQLPWLSLRTGVAYGPHPSVNAVFAKIGHVGYTDSGYFEPFIRFQPTSVMPHLALHAAERVTVHPDGLEVDGRAVPLTNGKTLVNFVSLGGFKGHEFSMRPLFELLDQGDSLEAAVQPGDVVLVSNTGVTGNVGDLHDSPLGRMRGSQIVAAQINSFLTGQWIASYTHTEVGVFLACLLGLALGLVARSLVFAALLTGATVLWVAGGLALFSFASIDVPWLFSGVAFGVAAVAQHLRSAFKDQLRSRVFKQALHRLVPGDKLERLAKRRGGISLAPQEQLVSLLFFDLVGFSILAEKRVPKELFFQLKEVLNLICDLVYAHGGMVDKILGDGALCLFGYSFEEGGSVAEHADQAVRCALAIQTAVLKRNLAAGADTDVFPVRVGVHSAPAFMGDLGASGKIEFTVIGPGVNFARRLEEACDPYRIMISAATRDVLKESRDEAFACMTRRDVGIKHRTELFEAYELDAFRDRPDLLRDALSQFTKTQGRQREEDRYLLRKERRFPVHFPMGTGFIEDFSRSGIRLNASFYVSSGVQATMSFEPDDCPLFEVLAGLRLTQVHILVKWGKPLADDRYSLGLQFVGLPPGLRQALVDTLRELA